jgi:hypothetical protein
MKPTSLISALTLGVLTLATLAHADTNGAVAAFQADPQAKQRLMKAYSDLQQTHGAGAKIQASASAIVIASGGGYAGTQSTYLVSQTFTPAVVNAQTTVLIGVVDEMLGKYAIKRIIPGGALDALFGN